MAIFHTGGVFSNLPHHLDLALEDSVGHSTGGYSFPCSADHEQDWQPYPVDPYSAICDDHTYIHTYMHECVGASQGYHGVVGGLGLPMGWLVG